MTYESLENVVGIFLQPSPAPGSHQVSEGTWGAERLVSPPASPRHFSSQEVARSPGGNCAVGSAPLSAAAMGSPCQVLPTCTAWPRWAISARARLTLPWGEQGGDIMASSRERGSGFRPALHSHGPQQPPGTHPVGFNPFAATGKGGTARLPQCWMCVLPVPAAGHPEPSGDVNPQWWGHPPDPHNREMTGSNSINMSEIPAHLYSLALLGNQCFWKIWKEKGF